MSRFDALIVDFGGVLTTPLQDALSAFARRNGLELQDLVRAALKAYAGDDDRLVTDFETGAIAEPEFAAQLSLRLAEETGVAIDSQGLIDSLFASLELEESMFAAVAKVRRAGLKCALLSNSWGEGIYPKERLSELFDVVVISSQVGLRKPDPAIFRLTTERLALAPGRCVFVDDHPGHLEAASEQGMTTVLHRSPETTIAELEALLDLELR